MSAADVAAAGGDPAKNGMDTATAARLVDDALCIRPGRCIRYVIPLGSVKVLRRTLPSAQLCGYVRPWRQLPTSPARGMLSFAFYENFVRAKHDSTDLAR